MDGLPLPLGLDGPLEGFNAFDGVDVVGHLSVVGFVDPSGHVCVDGFCGCFVHDGSEGFALQSTVSGGGVPIVQLLVHDGPVPFPPDAGIVMLFLVMLIGVVVMLVFGITINVVVADPDLPSADACTSTLNFPGVESPLILHWCEYMPWPFVTPVRGS